MIKIDEHREVRAEVLYIAVLSPYVPLYCMGVIVVWGLAETACGSSAHYEGEAGGQVAAPSSCFVPTIVLFKSCRRTYTQPIIIFQAHSNELAGHSGPVCNVHAPHWGEEGSLSNTSASSSMKLYY